ncbi:hypothetical protein F5X99DRAFT_410759 [Biscogniauxia marginata]|nr:hypothetical protein F5X99DRAFT_410759 [Biscogniauxia marginata]
MQMPERSGPDKYAVAKSLSSIQKQTLPHHLLCRGMDGDIQMRADSSNKPEYGYRVADEPAKRRRARLRYVFLTSLGATSVGWERSGPSRKAVVTAHYDTNEVLMFFAKRYGAASAVPGLVTTGFKPLGGLEDEATLGSGISPFIPTTAPTSVVAKLLHSFIFLFRLPLFLAYSAVFFLVLDRLPLPQVARKLLLWTMLGIPGIWWVDLQLDGVKRGSLSQQPAERFPRERALVAAQFTSPVDALYLAAIFDPIFTVSYPGTAKVRRVSLFRAVLLALSPPPALSAPPSSSSSSDAKNLTTLRALVEANPRRVVAVFPEMTTTNGKGILPFSPSLLSAPADAPIFPVSMRYTPADITTPIPGAWAAFLWNLLSKPTHYIRVRVAEGVTNTLAAANGVASGSGDENEEEEEDDDGDNNKDGEEEEEPLTPEEQRFIDHIGEALARLARNKRVGLTLRDKAAFVEAWNKGKK